MKIVINRVPEEGLYLEEEVDPAELDLATALIKITAPVKVTGQVTRITNALTIDLRIQAALLTECSRCLSEFECAFDKQIQLNCTLDSSDIFIDLNPNIRDEIILDYPMKPLCGAKCKGLCVKCGNNKNQGGCNCALT